MANHKGSEGAVYVGANAVAEIRSWSIQESANIIDDTEIGDAWKTKKFGTKEWNASIDVYWDETDTNGQGALAITDEVTLNLYPEGNASTDTYYTGSAIVTGITRNAAVDGMVEASITLEGNGALTESTVV